MTNCSSGLLPSPATPLTPCRPAACRRGPDEEERDQAPGPRPQEIVRRQAEHDADDQGGDQLDPDPEAEAERPAFGRRTRSARPRARPRPVELFAETRQRIGWLAFAHRAIRTRTPAEAARTIVARHPPVKPRRTGESEGNSGHSNEIAQGCAARPGVTRSAAFPPRAQGRPRRAARRRAPASSPRTAGPSAPS